MTVIPLPQGKIQPAVQPFLRLNRQFVPGEGLGEAPKHFPLNIQVGDAAFHAGTVFLQRRHGRVQKRLRPVFRQRRVAGMAAQLHFLHQRRGSIGKGVHAAIQFHRFPTQRKAVPDGPLRFSRLLFLTGTVCAASGQHVLYPASGQKILRREAKGDHFPHRDPKFRG